MGTTELSEVVSVSLGAVAASPASTAMALGASPVVEAAVSTGIGGRFAAPGALDYSSRFSRAISWASTSICLDC